MTTKSRNYWMMGIDRKVGYKLKNGFYLETPDGEQTGQITDDEFLEGATRKKISYKRKILTLEKNGFAFARVETDEKNIFEKILLKEEIGGLYDKYWLEDTPFEVGDVLRITLSPKNKNKIMIKIEYRWEDQEQEEEL